MNKISMQSEKPMEHKTEPTLAPRSGASELTGRGSTNGLGSSELTERIGPVLPAGFLIVNADDWGRDRPNTDRALECVLRKSVSSVSAMVFMEDSERAAGISREHGIDTGLHLNLTTPFTVSGCPGKLLEHHRRLSEYLSGSRFAQVVFHPGLVSSFAYVVEAQLKEFDRLYATAPQRVDGHHHMHLCANVLLAKLLPQGSLVRRSFTFQRGEKSFSNRAYRRVVDHILARRHRLADCFFSLPPLDPPSRLQRIFSLAKEFVIELETHPICPEEHAFLMGEEMLGLIGHTRIEPWSAMSLLSSRSRIAGS
jgi:hypothetical protein